MSDRRGPGPARARRTRPTARAIGVDEWVARVAGSREAGWQAAARARLERVPAWAKLPLLVLPIALFPLFTNSGYLMQVGIDTLIFMLLALGLNVAVGWAGLLDLGYVAFFGFGAYGYAMLASGHFDVHWQAQWVIPIVVAATVLLGFLVGLPSRRLVGDYLAIVTLFFLQLFLTILLNADRLNVPFHDGEVNVTRGPNGISDVDPLRFFGWRGVESLDDYFYLALGAFVVVVRRARVREQLADRPRLARAARGPARGGADEHAREPAEAARVRVRRRRRRPDRDAPRRRRRAPSSRSTST